MDTLREKIGEAINGAIDATAKPLLQKVLPLVFDPLLKLHVQCYRVLAFLIAELKKELSNYSAANEREFHWRVRSASWWIYWKVSDHCRNEVDPMLDVLRALGSVPPFNYLYPYGLYWAIRDNQTQLLNDAMFTIEKDARNIAALASGASAVVAKIDENYAELTNRYFEDSKTVTKETMEKLLWMLIGTPILKTVLDAPGVSDAINAADSLIPEPVKDLMSVSDCLEEVLKGVMGDVITHTVEENTAGAMEKLQAGFDALVANPGSTS